jgi:hypothetical protein
MRLVGHVARRGEAINEHEVFILKFQGKRPFGRHGINGRIILKVIIERYVVQL